MAAFALVIIVFLFWSMVGFALVSALYRRPNLMQGALLSPVSGVAATALLVVWLNCLGLPVRYGGPAATLILVILSWWLLRRYPYALPVRQLVPFMAVLVIAAMATGYPLLQFGFNWISFGNDDMANYALGAKLFLNHAQFQAPPDQDILAHRDLSLMYWYFYVAPALRHGVEELLAWVASCTGLSTLQAFMPLILALHLVLIASTGALVLQRKTQRKAALLVCFALALSALTALGMLYQLLGQVCGLGLLAGTLTVMLRPGGSGKRSEWVFAGILCAGTALVYPEILPFFVIPYLLYHAALVARKQQSVRDILARAVPVAICSVVLLNIMIVVTGITLLLQLSALRGAVTPQVLFPDYLTPAGLTYLWGFKAIGNVVSGPSGDIAIIAGAVLLLLAIGATVGQLQTSQPVAFASVLMIVLGIYLFTVKADFALYKLAMYIQPFVLGTLAVAWLQIHARCRRSTVLKIAWCIPLSTLIIYGATTQHFYTQRSLGTVPGSFVEILSASRSGLSSQLARLRTGQRGAWLSDGANVTLAKIEALYLDQIYFSTKDPSLSIVNAEYLSHLEVNQFNPFYLLNQQHIESLLGRLAAEYPLLRFDMHGALPSADDFHMERGIEGKGDVTVLGSSNELGVVNRRGRPVEAGNGSIITVVPQPKNYLLFVSSAFGLPPWPDTRIEDRIAGLVSMYQPEADYFFSGATIVSLGRDSLFRILDPSPKVRMVLEYTASLNADRENRVPSSASVIGDARSMLPVEGRGSARLFSPPVRPQEIDGGRYIALDMGTSGWSFPTHRSGLMRLYGADIAADTRRIVGFARDISLISESDYNAMKPPDSIQRFPDDLKNPDLQYSGIYEDGWVAESSYMVLGKTADATALTVSMNIPGLRGRSASSSLTLLVDGKEVGRRPVSSGYVSFQFRVEGVGDRKIELLFDRAMNLPDPDNRPVSAHLRYVGFQPATADSTEKEARP